MTLPMIMGSKVLPNNAGKIGISTCFTSLVQYIQMMGYDLHYIELLSEVVSYLVIPKKISVHGCHLVPLR